MIRTLTVEKLTKRFTLKGTPAIFETSFEAAPGGITTLLGPSGSGKTTLLRVISGLETADEGRVILGDEDITFTPVRDRSFGFVFQTFALFPDMNIKENIAFGLRVRKMKQAQIDARVEELLDLVKLQGLGHRYPSQLSGGQRQRVGFARALAPHPKILLLDEPFGALDAQVRLELRQFLRELHERTHITTLMVTHDQEEALELSDRIVVLDRGRIHQVGTPREIYEAPRTPFVASFVGMANVLMGRVSNGRASAPGVDVTVTERMPDGSPVRTIVRPHDLRISRDPNYGTPVTVARLVFAGSIAKVDVTTQSGESLSVHMPQDEVDRLALVAGDVVHLDAARARVFADSSKTFEPPLPTVVG
ncbi:MAG: ABC transporter ATP-binding protein [Deltaproteobacteria bacterium]|nr:ABC transporter ATP-binding protein [Deltaproteobacteria bacterium]